MCLWDRKVTLTLISHMKWYTIIQFFYSNNSGNFHHSIPCLQRKYKNTISVSYWLSHAIFFHFFLHIVLCWMLVLILKFHFTQKPCKNETFIVYGGFYLRSYSEIYIKSLWTKKLGINHPNKKNAISWNRFENWTKNNTSTVKTKQ